MCVFFHLPHTWREILKVTWRDAAGFGGHQKPLKRSLTHPKKVTIAELPGVTLSHLFPLPEVGRLEPFGNAEIHS